MKLEEQVTSLELSKKLKKLGVKQLSEFYWRVPVVEDKPQKGWFVTGFIDPNFDYGCCGGKHKDTSAFTVSELGDILPKNIISFFRRDNDEWVCNLHYLSECADENGDYKHYGKQITDKTEADSRAKMLIYLLENKLK